MCFSVNFAKFLRTTFYRTPPVIVRGWVYLLKDTSRQLTFTSSMSIKTLEKGGKIVQS